MPGRPATRAPRLNDAPGRCEFQREAGDVTVVASEGRACFRANPGPRTGEAGVFLLVHQRVINFLRRRADENCVFDVFRFHGWSILPLKAGEFKPGDKINIADHGA